MRFGREATVPTRSVNLTLIGGPTVLIELAGLRLLTDPTFDPPGSYPARGVTLTKQTGPAVPDEHIGFIDLVLLSHDQHADNLDQAGRGVLERSGRVLTTVEGAGRIGGGANGLEPWQQVEIATPTGERLRVTATPARHGPVGIEPLVGTVIGFALTLGNDRGPALYISGDTVWYDGVAEVARRFDVRLALLFTGAAQTRGSFHLTMDSNDAIEAAHAFAGATVVPVHNDGWAHFTQSRDDVAQAFNALGLGLRLKLLEPGVPTELPL